MSPTICAAAFEPFAQILFALRNVPIGGIECDFVQKRKGERNELTVCESKSGRVLAKGDGRVMYSVSGKEGK